MISSPPMGMPGRRGSLLLLLPFLFAAAMAASVLDRLSFQHDSRSLLRADADAERAQAELVERFGSEDILLVAWEAGDLTEPAEFAFLREVTRALQEVSGLEEIYSLASRTIQLPLGPGGLLRPLDESDLRDVAARARTRSVLRAAPVYVGTIYSEALDVLAVAGTVVPGPAEEREATLRLVREHVARLTSPGRELHVAGVTALAVDAGEYAVADLRRIGAAALVAAIAVLLVLCRSLRASLVAVIATGLPPLYALGCACALGLPMTALGAALFPVLAIVGITSSVHLLHAYAEEQARGEPAERAAWRAARRLAAPISLSLLTTGAAFLSLQATGVPAFHTGGAVVALGLACAVPVILVGLPAALCLIRPPFPPTALRRTGRGLLALAIWSMRRRRALLAGAVLLCVTGLLLASRAPLRIDILQAFRPESRLARTYRFLDERLTATVPLDVVLRARRDASDAEILEDLERFSERALREPGVRSAISAATLVRYGRSILPVDIGPDAALLYLRTNLAPVLDRFEHRGSRSYRVKLRIKEGSPPNVFDRVREAARALSTGEAELTGLFARAVDTTRRLRGDLLRGVLLMLLLVVGTVTLATRSWRLGLAALLPNLLAPAALFGGCTLLGIPLDVSAVAVGAVAVGLAVDDTLHVVFRIVEERRRGRAPAAAALRAQRCVGRALLLSTLGLVAGLGCLQFSAFLPTARFGLFGACAATIALAGDLLLIPASVRMFRAR